MPNLNINQPRQMLALQSGRGTPGTKWRSGAGAPSNSLGLELDLYLNTSNGDVYRKLSGVYTVICNIKGPAGDDGAIGSVWRNGSGVPDNSVGLDGDYYLNVDNGDVYERISGTYSLVANIKGPAGDDANIPDPLIVTDFQATNSVNVGGQLTIDNGGNINTPGSITSGPITAVGFNLPQVTVNVDPFTPAVNYWTISGITSATCNLPTDFTSINPGDRIMVSGATFPCTFPGTGGTVSITLDGMAAWVATSNSTWILTSSANYYGSYVVTMPDGTLPALSGQNVTSLNPNAMGSGLFPAGIDASNLYNLPASALIGPLPAIDGSALTNMPYLPVTGTTGDWTTTGDTNLTIQETMTAARFNGDGTNITNLQSSNLTGALPALDGSALTNIPSSSLTGALPAIDGSALTGVISTPSNPLLDASANSSVDFDNRVLNNFLIATLRPSLDWLNGYLYDINGDVLPVVLNWDTQQLYDDTGIISIDWNARTLSNDISTCLDWNNHYLYDGSTQVAVDWTNRYLYNALTDGGTILDWSGSNPNGAHYWFDSANNFRLTGDGSGLTNIPPPNWLSRGVATLSGGQCTIAPIDMPNGVTVTYQSPSGTLGFLSCSYSGSWVISSLNADTSLNTADYSTVFWIAY